MAITIYGIPYSQNVRKPLAVAAHLGIAVENAPLTPLDALAREKYPAARIPFMEENGRILGESNAIMIHLCSRKPNSLYPDNQSVRDEINQWLFFDAAQWTPAYQPIQFERLVKKRFKLGATDEAVVEASLVKFRREAAYLDAHLEGREWLVGETATLADFAVGAGLTHAKAMDLPIGDYPNLIAWNARVMALEGFRKTAG